MLPFHEGEAAAIANAFHLCSRALEELRLNKKKLDQENVQAWIDVIEKTMDTTGLEDPTGSGLWYIRAQALTTEQKSAFSDAVHELADWFHMEYWSGDN
jgi:truncated hemoglobin YjbI